MTLTFLDHVLVFVLVVVLPLLDFRSLRKKRALIEQGQAGVRARIYSSIIWHEWLTIAVLLVIWVGLGRPLSVLTEVTPFTSQTWVGYLIAAVVLALLYFQVSYVMNDANRRQAVRAQMSDTRFMIPETENERRRFALLSLTAGICEELLYRAYLITYLLALTGLPLWVAIAVSSMAFGFIHIYQGPSGVVRTAIAGLVFGAVYGLTGSIWAPIVLHIALDLSSGQLGSLLLEDSDDSGHGSVTRQMT